MTDYQYKQKSRVIILGENPFEHNLQEYGNLELITLRHRPTFNQVMSFAPSALIFNLEDSQQLVHLIEVAKQFIDSDVRLPRIAYGGKHLNIADKTSFELEIQPGEDWDGVARKLSQILETLSSEVDLLKSITELRGFQDAVQREMQRAGIFQSALFKRAAKKTNLKVSYHSVFRREIGGDFFEIFDLSPSHVGILIGDINANVTSAALLSGFLFGQLHSIQRDRSDILWSPNELLALLSDSIYSLNMVNDMHVKAWYGVIDLASRKLEFSSAGHIPPLLISDVQTQAAYIASVGGSFPLGMFPGMTYKRSVRTLGSQARLMFYTDGLVTQRACKESISSAQQDWLQALFTETSKQPVEDIPAIVDARFTDLISSSEIEDDLLILCCEPIEPQRAYVPVAETKEDDEDIIWRVRPQDVDSACEQVMQHLPENLAQDARNDFELSMRELLSKAVAQIHKALLIAIAEGNLTKPKGAELCWWVHPNKLDISVRLDKGAIPWSYDGNTRNIEQGYSLIFLFDHVCVSQDGLEVSVSKVLN